MNPYANKSPEEIRDSRLKGVATRRANKAARLASYESADDRLRGLLTQERRLIRRLDELRKHELFSARSASLTGKRLLRAAEIVEQASRWEAISGIYFLVRDDAVVYVGQSLNLYVRIACHAAKNFDRVAFILCSPDQLDVMESLYIHLLEPELNGDHGGKKVAPLGLHELAGSINKSNKGAR